MSEEDLVKKHLEGRKLAVYVRTGKPKSRIAGWDRERAALVVELRARPEKGMANSELCRLLSRAAGKTAAVSSGKASRKKTIVFC